MFYAYILLSLKDSSYYYGSTGREISERLNEHNSGKVKYTKGHLPYKLHYFESYNSRSKANKKERFFKSIDGYKWLKIKGII
jgi:putative endonuclease